MGNHIDVYFIGASGLLLPAYGVVLYRAKTGLRNTFVVKVAGLLLVSNVTDIVYVVAT